MLTTTNTLDEHHSDSATDEQSTQIHIGNISQAPLIWTHFVPFIFWLNYKIAKFVDLKLEPIERSYGTFYRILIWKPFRLNCSIFS